MSAASSALVAFLDFTFAGIRRRVEELDREHAAQLAKVAQETHALREHLKAADAENESLRELVNDYASKLAIRDSEVTRLEVALEDALLRAKWGE